MLITLLVFGGGLYVGHKLGYWRGRSAPLPKTLDSTVRKLLKR